MGFAPKVVVVKPSGNLDGLTIESVWGTLEGLRGNNGFSGVVKDIFFLLIYL